MKKIVTTSPHDMTSCPILPTPETILLLDLLNKARRQLVLYNFNPFALTGLALGLQIQ